IYNCDDAGVVPSEQTYEVTGTVSGWTLGNKVLKAIVRDSSGSSTFLADSTGISSNGAFTLKLKTPPDNFIWIYTIPPTGTTCTGNFTITPSNLKNASVTFSVYDSTGVTAMGSVQRKNSVPPPQAGAFLLSYVYFDNNASVTGTRLCYTTPPPSADSINVTCSYSGNKGWQPVVTLWNSFRVWFVPPGSYQDIQVSASEPPGGAWYYVP
ncbi:MAG TPA: hypothetical protein VGK25_03915, partial [Ignavibacteria bacterium]